MTHSNFQRLYKVWEFPRLVNAPLWPTKELSSGCLIEPFLGMRVKTLNKWNWYFVYRQEKIRTRKKFIFETWPLNRSKLQGDPEASQISTRKRE